MKIKIAILLLASALSTPAFAGKFDLATYKTVAVQPVLSASNSRGLFESQLAASAAMLSIKPEGVEPGKKAGNAFFERKQGFGFAGKAQAADMMLLAFGNAVGALPMMMKLDLDGAKQQATQLQALLGKLEGKVNPQVVEALTLAVMAAQAGEFELTMKAVLAGMAVSADSITKGSERAHGYMATGLYTGTVGLFALSGQPNQALADLSQPLVMYLEQDAALGGADRKIAAQLKLVGAEVAKPAPDFNNVFAAMQAMNAVKPD